MNPTEEDTSIYQISSYPGLNSVNFMKSFSCTTNNKEDRLRPGNAQISLLRYRD